MCLRGATSHYVDLFAESTTSKRSWLEAAGGRGRGYVPVRPSKYVSDTLADMAVARVSPSPAVSVLVDVR